MRINIVRSDLGQVGSPEVHLGVSGLAGIDHILLPVLVEIAKAEIVHFGFSLDIRG